MLRRCVTFRSAIPARLCTSKPLFEVLQAAAGGVTEFDSSNPRVAKMVALLHRNQWHNVGDYVKATPAAKKAIADAGEDGAYAMQLLDKTLSPGTTTGENDASQKVLIAFGSQTGTAEALARMTGLMASAHGLTPVVVSMNDAVALLKDRAASGAKPFAASLFLTSTYGTGEWPSNAGKFFDALSRGELTAALKSSPSAVFGLGNSNNADNFNAAAKMLTTKLSELGIPSLTKSTYSCERAEEGHDTAFRTWKSSVWSALGRDTASKDGAVPDIYTVSQIYSPAENIQGPGVRKFWLRAHVTYNELRSARNFEPVYRHMIAEVPITDQIHILGRKLLPTDQLVVHPHNKRDAVDRALKRFGLTGGETIEVTPLPGATPSFFDGKKITTRTLFREIIDLSAVPARSSLSMLASAATDAKEAKALDELANDLTASSEYSKLTQGADKILTVLDVLERFGSVKLTLAQAVSRLPHISSRYYSNAHDPRSKLSDQFHVIYNVPQRHEKGTGRVHKGLATSNLEACTPGASSVWCTVEAGKSTFPKVSSDVVLIGLGSGIGLVMAALEQRATALRADKNSVGKKCTVIYGFRNTGKDQLFKEELEKYVASGVITDLRLVGSYDTAGKFVSPFDQLDKGLCDAVRDGGAEVLYCGVGGSVPHILASHFAKAGINVTAMRKAGTYHEEYFTTDLDSENLIKDAAASSNENQTLAQRFGDCDMFCFQCEQTFKGRGCVKVGVCGKTPAVSALQDLTVHYAKILGHYAHNLRQISPKDPALTAINRLTLFALFTTLTNVNFDEARFVDLLRRLHESTKQLAAAYESACKAKGATPVPLPKDTFALPAAFPAGATAEQQLIDAGRAVGVLTRFVDAGAQNSAAVCELLTYGLKGIAAYADHALMNGVENEAIYSFVHKALAFLVSNERHDLNAALGFCLEAGKCNVETMSTLYQSHKTLGVPSPHAVPVKPTPGKCILVSGHDLIILRELLPLCEKEGINVYTHGEMLPAHGYPELRKYKALAGHFGSAWQRQSIEFPHFPGAILMTTNCLTEPSGSYGPRLFTAGAVGWKGVKHVGTNLEDIKFDDVIAAAKAAPGFTPSQAQFAYPDPIGVKRPASLTVGFGHETILSVAPTVIEQIQKGNITRFYVVGGCDGYEGGRSYFTDLVKNLPPTSVVLTVGCGKFKINHLDHLGNIGDTGIPRIMDVGQCNDAFSTVQVALALADTLKCQVSDLPLSLAISWLEQKAAAVLLSLLYLGIKPIRLGPSLPAFITKDVLAVLVEKFGVLPCDNAVDDVKKMVAAKGMIEK